jgi:hypothetical protein
MMNKRDLSIYRIVTGLFSALMIMGAGMYFFNNEMAVAMFKSLGYPTYIIYPLGILKLLGLVAIWTRKSDILKEWAYAGYVFVFVLAISAHINVSDGGFGGATMALVLVLISYAYSHKLYNTNK